MSNRKRQVCAPMLSLEPLEDRCLLTAWPIQLQAGQVPTLLETYGQYQELSPVVVGPNLQGVPQGSYDNSIHMHEGIDIPAAANTTVRAVQRGRVEVVFNAVANGLASSFRSFVVLRNVDSNDVPIDSGWNYKHTIPLAGIQQGQILAQGAALGTVAAAPALSGPDHLHLDFGPENPNFNPNNPNSARDPTIQNILNANSFPNAAERNAIRYQFASRLNPLGPFVVPDRPLRPIVVDRITPTIQTLDFRIARDDQLGITANLSLVQPGASGPFNQPAEIPRTGANAHYFRQTLPIGGRAITNIGRLRSAGAGQGNLVVPPAAANGNIDFVVGAFDRISGNTPLNPLSFDLSLTGQFFQATFGPRISLNFEAWLSPQAGVGNFWNLGNTRAANENDNAPVPPNQHHNSQMLRSPWFYILTNSPNLSQAFVPGDIQAGHTSLFWNSDGVIAKSCG